MSAFCSCPKRWLTANQRLISWASQHRRPFQTAANARTAGPLRTCSNHRQTQEGVELKTAVICEDSGTVALISDIGRVLRLPVEEQPPLDGQAGSRPRWRCACCPERPWLQRESPCGFHRRREPLLLFLSERKNQIPVSRQFASLQTGRSGCDWVQPNGMEKNGRIDSVQQVIGSGLQSSSLHGRILAVNQY